MTKEELDAEKARVSTTNCAAFHKHVDGLLALAPLQSPLPIPTALNQTRLFLRNVFKYGSKVRVARSESDQTIFRILDLDWVADLKQVAPCGVWIALNPILDASKKGRGGGLTDASMGFDHILVEMDSGARAQQLMFWEAAISIGVPVLSLTDSGGKSYHALIRITAEDKPAYKKVAGHVRSVMAPFIPDPKVGNNSRLTRLPGVPRKAKNGFQNLVYLNPSASVWDPEASYVSILHEFAVTALTPPVQPKAAGKPMGTGESTSDEDTKAYAAELRSIVNGQAFDVVKLIDDCGLSNTPTIPEDEAENRDERNFIWCPWRHEHTGGGENDKEWDAYLYRRRKSKAFLPWGFHCSHGHCDGRKFTDFLSQCKTDFPEAFADCVTPFPDLTQLFEDIQPPDETLVSTMPEDLLAGPPSIPDDGAIFRHLHNGKVKYLKDAGLWYSWTGSHWERGAREMVKQVWYVRAKSAEADSLPAIKKSAHPAYLDAILDYVKTETWAETHSGEFNRNAYLLGCPNGTLDLRTGIIRETRPEDMISMRVRVNYHPEAPRTRFERFMGEIHPDNPDITNFLQRWLGYTLTGSVQEHKMVIFHGPKGRNGKSTLVEAVRDIMNDYGIAIQSSALAAMKGLNANTASPATASLKDKRMIITSEVNEGMLLDESLVKSLCSGDTISARPIHGQPMEFPMRGKITMSTNHRPQVRGTDNAIWSRLVLVEFKESFLGKEDQGLEDALKAEAEGILAWMVEGAMAWHREGLGIPQEIRQYTEGHRTEQDQLEQFITECCETGSGRVSRKDLFESYAYWASKSRQKAYSRQDFVQKLEQKGFQGIRIKGERFWSLLELKTADLPFD